MTGKWELPASFRRGFLDIIATTDRSSLPHRRVATIYDDALDSREHRRAAPRRLARGVLLLLLLLLVAKV